MNYPTNDFLSTILALSAALLGIAVLVQMLQEVYKYLTNSKSKAYRQALEDVLGGWSRQLFKPEILHTLAARSPWQFSKLSPRGVLNPVEPSVLIDALERTAPYWIRQCLEAIRMESKLQQGIALLLSPAWKKFIEDLSSVTKYSPDYSTAKEVADFLKEWNAAQAGQVAGPSEQDGISIQPQSDILDVAKLEKAFVSRFLGHVVEAEKNLPQLDKNFEYIYGRRNLRHTFIIAFLLAFLCKLPFDRLYEDASRVSADEAIAIAERVTSAYTLTATQSQDDERNFAVDSVIVADIWKQVLQRKDNWHNYIIDWSKLQEMIYPDVTAFLRYVLGCLVTAILVAFGAPFWNDATSLLLAVAKSRRKLFAAEPSESKVQS